jgi:hypothetical protein
MKPSSITPDYRAFLREVKDRIQSARLQAGRAVDRELVMLYWDIGRGIVEKQKRADWGEAVVERLADLRGGVSEPARVFGAQPARDETVFPDLLGGGILATGCCQIAQWAIWRMDFSFGNGNLEQPIDDLSRLERALRNFGG